MKPDNLTPDEFLTLICGACADKAYCTRRKPDTIKDKGGTVTCFNQKLGTPDPMCSICALDSEHNHSKQPCYTAFERYTCWRRRGDMPVASPMDFTPRYECGIRKGGGK